MYTIYVIDTIGEAHVLEFKKFEYRNLMELLVNRLHDEIGDCKGRGLCGTCHIRVHSSNTSMQFFEGLEENILKKQLDYYPNSRLACQILLDEHIDTMQIEIIGGD